MDLPKASESSERDGEGKCKRSKTSPIPVLAVALRILVERIDYRRCDLITVHGSIHAKNFCCCAVRSASARSWSGGGVFVPKICN
jgi:hypothetical protein